MHLANLLGHPPRFQFSQRMELDLIERDIKSLTVAWRLRSLNTNTSLPPFPLRICQSGHSQPPLRNCSCSKMPSSIRFLAR
jgi:hypothetical protein